MAENKNEYYTEHEIKLELKLYSEWTLVCKCDSLNDSFIENLHAHLFSDITGPGPTNIKI